MQPKPDRKPIKKHVADNMRKLLKDPNGKKTKKYYFHWDMYDDVVEGNEDRVSIIPVRFDAEGAEDYRCQWGFIDGHPRGPVEGYTTFIIKIDPKNDDDCEQSAPAESLYFHFATICPPPVDCPEQEPSGDS